MKKTFFAITAVIEAGAGLALIIWPSAAVMLLLGSSLDNPAGLTLGRVAGAALLALGVACWLARHNAESRPVAGLIMAMLLYNSAVVLLLAIAGRFFWAGRHLPMASCCSSRRYGRLVHRARPKQVGDHSPARWAYPLSATSTMLQR